MTGTKLELLLAEKIRREGPMTFYEFMKAALYHPELGYYNTESIKIGPQGDYYTSSNVHSAFGATLAKSFRSCLSSIDITENSINLMEAGAGTGQLAADILNAIRDDHNELLDNLRYIIIENSPHMREQQFARLKTFGDRVRWLTLEELEHGKPVGGIIFSNELMDAFPVHIIRRHNRRLEELYVTEQVIASDQTREQFFKSQRENLLDTTWGNLSIDRTRMLEYLNITQLDVGEGHVIEVNLDAAGWLERMSKLLRNGFIITIDYGDVSGRLFQVNPSGGTVRSFYRHTLIESPLERPGEQDITASVNFTALVEYGRRCGLETLELTTLPEFLIRHGLIDRLARLEETAADSVASLKEKLAIKNLFLPGGIGASFRVLVQKKV